MLDNATDVIQGGFAQTRVAVASKQVLAVLAQGHVNVHAGAVIANHRLGHEGRRLTVGVSDVMDAVLENLHLVRLAYQGVGANADLALAGRAHFVVMDFHVEIHRFHGGTHGTTQVVQRIHRRYREIAAFHAGAVADVVAVKVLAGYPGCFLGMDLVHGGIHVHFPLGGIEDEEFGLRAEKGGVGDPGGLHVVFRAACHGAGVALVALHGGGLNDIAGNVDRRFFSERVQRHGIIIRHQDHVGFVNALPAVDGGAIKHLAVGEEVVIHFLGGQRYVHLFTVAVGESQVHPFNVVFLDKIHRLAGHGQNSICGSY